MPGRRLVILPALLALLGFACCALALVSSASARNGTGPSVRQSMAPPVETPSSEANEADEANGTVHQLQIGATRDLAGAKVFAIEAARTLNRPVRVVRKGEWALVLAGEYPGKRHALADFLAVNASHPCFVVSYDLEPVASYGPGDMPSATPGDESLAPGAANATGNATTLPPETFQVQIGATPDREGAKAYAAQAAKVLQTRVNVLDRGQWVLALVGSYATQQQAARAAMDIRPHYQCFVVSYRLDPFAAYGPGGEIDLNVDPANAASQSANGASHDLRALGLSAEEARMIIDETLQEVFLADKARPVVAAFMGATVSDCALEERKSMGEYVFIRSFQLGAVEPKTSAAEPYGSSWKLTLRTKGDRNAILFRQERDGHVISEHRNSCIELRPTGNQTSERGEVLGAMLDLARFCASRTGARLAAVDAEGEGNQTNPTAIGPVAPPEEANASARR